MNDIKERILKALHSGKSRPKVARMVGISEERMYELVNSDERFRLQVDALESNARRPRIWTVIDLLWQWGTWYEHGRLRSALPLYGDNGDGFSGQDEAFHASQYVEGNSPPCSYLSQAFVYAKPALVHRYAKCLDAETFDTPLLPGQSAKSRAIICNVMVSDFTDVLTRRMREYDYNTISRYEVER